MMKAIKLISIGVAVSVVVASAVWLFRADPLPDTTGTAAVGAPTEPALNRVEASEDVIEAPAPSDSIQTEETAAEDSIDDEATLRQQGMASSIYRVLGGQIAQTLAGSGLAQSDSEGIARRYAEDMAACYEGAFVTEAARQSISVDGLMAGMEAALDFGDINLSDVPMSDVLISVSEVMDVSSMEAGMMPCMVAAVQSAGISLEAMIEIMGDQFGMEFPTALGGPF